MKFSLNQRQLTIDFPAAPIEIQSLWSITNYEATIIGDVIRLANSIGLFQSKGPTWIMNFCNEISCWAIDCHQVGIGDDNIFDVDFDGLAIVYSVVIAIIANWKCFDLEGPGGWVVSAADWQA